MYKFDSKRDKFYSISEARSNLEYSKQEKESNEEFYDTFCSHVEAFEHFGGTIGNNKGLIEEIHSDTDPDNPGAMPEGTAVTVAELTKWINDTAAYEAALRKKMREKYLAMMFLKKCNQQKYGGLWTSLKNNYSRGTDQYPDTLSKAYSMICTHTLEFVTNRRNNRRNGSNSNNSNSTPQGILFLQQGTVIAGTDGNSFPFITCFKCRRKGHYANLCPGTDNDVNFNALQVEEENDDKNQIHFMFTQMTFVQGNNRSIPDTWVLLDSQSTTSIFHNDKLLKDIREVPEIMTLVTNGGIMRSNMKGNIVNFGPVWYNPKSLANILSLSEVCKHCRVTMDTSMEAAITVHRKKGTTMKFLEFDSGLYYYDTASNTSNHNKITLNDYCSVENVAENRTMFTSRQVKAADDARRLYAMLKRPSQRRFEQLLASNAIANCTVTTNDAKQAVTIYGPDAFKIKASSVKERPTPIPSFVSMTLPTYILQEHKDVTLCADFFYVQGQVFLHSLSRNIKFHCIANVDNRSKETQLSFIKGVIDIYTKRGFVINHLVTDIEFDCIQQQIRPVTLETVAKDDHVGDIKRGICAIKDGIRGTIQSLPYKRYPKITINHQVEDMIKPMNALPASDGISDNTSPLTIVTGAGPIDYSKLRIEFGAYAQVFEDNKITNNADTQAHGCIALSCYPNENDKYLFMNLNTGQLIWRRQFTKLPIIDLVINQVHELASNDKHCTIISDTPMIKWRPGIPVLDDLDFSLDFKALICLGREEV